MNECVFLFCKKQTNRANKPHGLCMRTNFLLGIPNKANKKANKPNNLKGLFAIVRMSQVIKKVIGSALIGVLKNNQTNIRTMYFFSSWFVWLALFGLFALF